MVSSKPKNQCFVYIGTYTTGASQGIHTGILNLETGFFDYQFENPGVENPSFLAISPNRRFLYAVNETMDFQDAPGGSVTAFQINPKTGMLNRLNQQPTGGSAPCHIVIDQTGTLAVVSNYGGGSITILPILANGQLDSPAHIHQYSGSGPNLLRQEGPHAHSAVLAPDNRHAYVADLGTDRIMAYDIDLVQKALIPKSSPVAVRPGAGPRHFAFHPYLPFLFLINELTSTITAFTYAGLTGALTPIQTIATLPSYFDGENTSADLHVHPSGKFLYGSNRGHDSICIFTIEPDTGRLTLLGHSPTGGHTPRSFAIDPTGKFLFAANQHSSTITGFCIHPDEGFLVPTGQTITIPDPVNIQFLAS